jgi:hypothetical protein
LPNFLFVLIPGIFVPLLAVFSGLRIPIFLNFYELFLPIMAACARSSPGYGRLHKFSKLQRWLTSWHLNPVNADIGIDSR